MGAGLGITIVAVCVGVAVSVGHGVSVGEGVGVGEGVEVGVLLAVAVGRAATRVGGTVGVGLGTDGTGAVGVG